MADFHIIATCPSTKFPANPRDMNAMLEVLLNGKQCAVRGYTRVCEMTVGKDHRTYDLAQAIAREEIEREAWFSEYLGHGPNWRYGPAKGGQIRPLWASSTIPDGAAPAQTSHERFVGVARIELVL